MLNKRIKIQISKSQRFHFNNYHKKQIKNKIIATKKTGQVTKAMESVSAVKMRKSQERAFLGRPYVHSAVRILGRLATMQDSKKKYLKIVKLK